MGPCVVLPTVPGEIAAPENRRYCHPATYSESEAPRVVPSVRRSIAIDQGDDPCCSHTRPVVLQRSRARHEPRTSSTTWYRSATGYIRPHTRATVASQSPCTVSRFLP